MHSFFETNQARLALKMQLSQYWWFKNIIVQSENNNYHIVVYVHKIDNDVKKVISPVFKGISVKTETSNKLIKQKIK